MYSNDWVRPLKNAVRRVTEREVWGFDPDAPHPRVQGQFGSEVRVFSKQFRHLFLCFDVSEGVDFTRDYADVIDCLDRFYKGIGKRFKRIHVNFWAENSYVIEPFSIRGQRLLSEISKRYAELEVEPKGRRAFASAIVKPFGVDEQWFKLRPDMLLIFTSDNIENDPADQNLHHFRRFRERTVWVCLTAEKEPDLSVISSIEPKLKRRVVPVVKHG